MKNRLRELLAAGDTAIGAMIQLPSAPVVEVLAQAGFDWLVIDTEHGPIGIDLVLIGPNDLSGSMGLLGQVSHAAVQAAIDRVLQAAKKAHVPAGIFGVSAAEVNRYIAQGFQAVLAGVDVAFLAAGASGMLNQIKR